MLVFATEYDLASHFVNEEQADDEAQRDIIVAAEHLLKEVSPNVLFGRGAELVLSVYTGEKPTVFAFAARNKTDKQMSTTARLVCWNNGRYCSSTVPAAGLFEKVEMA